MSQVRNRDDKASEPAPEAQDRSRAAARIGAAYLLRTLQQVGVMSGGELLTGLVSVAIVQANVAHIDQHAAPDQTYAGLPSSPPDEMRRPVSVLALSASLGIPYETTRRHVEKLLKSGHCQRVKGGVIVSAAVVEDESYRQLIVGHMASLRRLLRDLKRAGVSLD